MYAVVMSCSWVIRSRAQHDTDPESGVAGELCGIDFLSIFVAHFQHLDLTALRHDGDTLLVDCADGADRACYVGQSAAVLLAGVEDLQLPSLPGGPGAGSRIAAADQV